MQNRGKKGFSIFITILVIVILSLVGFLAYYYITNYIILKEAEEAVEIFEEELENIVEEPIEENIIEEQENTTIQSQNQTSSKTSSQTSTKKVTTTYCGYNMVGTIQIPKTNIKAPIVDKVTTKSISAAVGILYGSGLNRVGNTVLVAHNYRNGTFFSNNKKLVIGDKIYITDSTATKIEYTIYNTYITSDMDFSYATRDTNGKREISLSTCTTDASKRLVVLARES